MASTDRRRPARAIDLGAGVMKIGRPMAGRARAIVPAMLLVLVVGSAGCGGSVRPHRHTRRGAASEERERAQVDDHRLTASLHEALVAAGLGAGIRPFAYMGHAFLVGSVQSSGDQDRAFA